MADAVTNHLAEAGHRALHESTGRVVWIWTDSRERGVDVARQMCKLKFGAFSTSVVPEDTLPAYAVNLDTGTKVFVLCQRDHVDTVLVTMTEDATADLLSVETSADESRYWTALAQGRVPGSDKGILDYLDQTTNEREFASQGAVKAPHDLYVDEEFPDWSYLRGFIGSHTKVHMTDRVKYGPPLKSDEEKLREELSYRFSKHRPHRIKPD